MAQVQALARPGDGHVHQPALLLEPVVVAHRVLVREQALLHAADEHAVELQALARMHRHQLDRVLPGLGLVVAGLQRGMGQEGGQRRHGLAGFGVRRRHGPARVGRQLVDRQRDRIASEPLLGHETLGRVDQLLQVFDAVRAFAFGLVVFDQPAVLEHQLDDLAQRQALGLLAQYVDTRDEGAQIGAGLARDGGRRVVQRLAGTARCVLQLLQAARADAARREVDDPQETGVVARVLQQAQVGQRMLDLGAFEKAQAAIDPVRHAGVEQRRLDDPALRVAAIQHRDLLAIHAIAHQLAHLVDHPLRLGQVAGRLDHAHRLARALVGAQVLAQALGVVADQRIGAVQDVAVAAVVLLELDLVLHVELAHEVGHVADPRAAKRIDALVVVAHGQHAARGAEVRVTGHGGIAAATGQQLDPGVLQLVGVLELVDQDVAEPPLVMFADRIVVA